MKKIRFNILIFYLILFIFFSFYSCSSSKMARPNAVFLIIVDTLRADFLSCYGFKHLQTSEIDKLALQGLLFTNSMSVASWTRPSVASILTSKYPSQLGLIEKPISKHKKFLRRERRVQVRNDLFPLKSGLPRILGSNGYYTVAFVNQPSLTVGNGFQYGFKEYYYPVYNNQILCHLPGKKHSGKQEWKNLGDAWKNDKKLINEFAHWLKNNSKKKMFVWLHLLTPHRPYNAPFKFHLPKEIEKVFRLTSKKRQKKVKRYCEEIKAVDFLVGKIVSIIKEHIGLKKSIIIFTSDHGEEFWDHGEYEHGHSLHREVIHIPLIFIANSLQKGSKINQMVRSIDILPSILGLVGIQNKPEYQLEGHDITQLKGLENNSELSVFSEAMLYGDTEQSLINGKYKLIANPSKNQWRLFDINNDIMEDKDIANLMPKKIKEMKNQINTIIQKFKQDYNQLKNDFKNIKDLDSKKDLEALRSLGYLQN